MVDNRRILKSRFLCRLTVSQPHDNSFQQVKVGRNWPLVVPQWSWKPPQTPAWMALHKGWAAGEEVWGFAQSWVFHREHQGRTTTCLPSRRWSICSNFSDNFWKYSVAKHSLKGCWRDFRHYLIFDRVWFWKESECCSWVWWGREKRERGEWQRNRWIKATCLEVGKQLYYAVSMMDYVLRLFIEPEA